MGGTDVEAVVPVPVVPVVPEVLVVADVGVVEVATKRLH